MITNLEDPIMTDRMSKELKKEIEIGIDSQDKIAEEVTKVADNMAAKEDDL